MGNVRGQPPNYNCRIVRDDVIRSAVEQVTVAVLEALARDEAPTSAALRFLLRSYSATGRDDIRDAIEPALARALELAPAAPADEQPRWLLLFAEAASMSGDERLPSMTANLAQQLRSMWGRDAQPLHLAAERIDACLRAASPASIGTLMPSAIDELERLVGAAYQPGHGVSERFADQIATASALITAYQVTDRLPYSMLAEELVQGARRTMWDEQCGAFCDSGADAREPKPFVLNCEAVGVLSRLAALHRSAEYRDAAVIAPSADYEEDAARILESLAADAPAHGLAGAVYGLAATEFHSVL
jgi:uncharacterized protein YyaL (SSP411 family)